MDYRGKRVLVIGAAVTGIPVVKALVKQGALVTLNDCRKKEDIPLVFDELKEYHFEFVGGGHPETLLENCDFIVVSPGLPLTIPLISKAIASGIEVLSEIELASRLSKTPVAAITGTNGKTTTTTLLGEIMKAAGRKAIVAGNIGQPMIAEVEQSTEEDIFVLEVSSFQLETTYRFKPTVSAILNITPDHLDRHLTMENYVHAKCKIFRNQDTQDFTILNMDNDETRKLASMPGSRVLFFSRKEVLEEGAWIENGCITINVSGKKESIMHQDEIFIPGEHSLENALAAALMAYCLGAEKEAVANTLKTFKGVEHRLEYVDEIEQVLYYNDSKGTNPDASIKAIKAMKRPTVLIAGGYDKGVEFHEFVNVFGDRVKALVLLGKTAPKIKEAANSIGFIACYMTDSLESAVMLSQKLAGPGDCVLLSPACASWDMFKDYEERGRMFKEYVRALRRF